MSEKEIKEKLESISKDLKLFDMIVGPGFRSKETTLNERQAVLVRDLFELFRKLKWQLSFNAYKELTYEKSPVIDTRESGTPVRVRSCNTEKHGDKTYFGILIGDAALSISHSIDKDGNVTAKHSMYNPAIFVPELNDIIYGCGSFWGRIESKEELDKLITDDTISSVWYMKLLKEGFNGEEEE